MSSTTTAEVVDATVTADAASKERTGRCKKRFQNFDNYRRNEAKKARLAHIPHVTRSGQPRREVESNFEVHDSW